MTVGLGTVNRFVATGGPAGALLQARGVIAIADENAPVAGLLLEVALQAKIRVPLRKQSLVDRAMRRMAADAAFTDRFVFKYEWSALRGMTLETGLVVAEQGGAPARDALRQIRAAALYRVTLVRIMAIRAADFALQHRVMMRQLEGRLHFCVALETGGR